ncbi:hypothetical protein DMUE_3094 [Dictyocoela muelleri]|nr:hypothetical protein DMUE_3094 [Dictyocoela muelleri]
MFIYLIYISALLTETETSLGKMELIGTKKTNKGLELRVGDKSGIIRFNNRNPNKNWSFEFSFNDIDLEYPSRAGIYMWYTKDPVVAGDYLGINGKINGFMAGIEFFGKRVQLLIGANDGTHDLSDIEDIVVMRDSVHPERFRNIQNFRVKVISTEKNFKMEVYDGEKMVYDYLRFTKTSALGDRSEGKLFSISADYGKHVPFEKRFIVNNIKLYKRIEGDDYDVDEVKAPGVSITPRYHDEILYPNKEIQHLIANLEHFMTYMESVLGRPMGSSVIQNSYDTAVLANKQVKKVGEIETAMKDMKNQIQRMVKLNENNRMNDIDQEILSLQRSLFEIKTMVKHFETSINSKIKNSCLMLGLLIILLSCFQFLNYKIKNKKKISLD